MKKEWSEWITSWCDKTELCDKPRIALIGDSIARGYQSFVREFLQDVCYVDYISTSYAIDMPIYTTLIEAFAADSSYDLILFNNGLHGNHISREEYESKMRTLSCMLLKHTQHLLLCTSTVVYEPDNVTPNKLRAHKVIERNAIVKKLAKELSVNAVDLYACSLTVRTEHRAADGTHYLNDGYNVLGKFVSEAIREELHAIKEI